MQIDLLVLLFLKFGYEKYTTVSFKNCDKMFKQLTERLSFVVSVVCRQYSSLILVSDVSINIFILLKF